MHISNGKAVLQDLASNGAHGNTNYIVLQSVVL